MLKGKALVVCTRCLNKCGLFYYVQFNTTSAFNLWICTLLIQIYTDKR